MGHIDGGKETSVMGDSPSDDHSGTEVEAGTQHAVFIDAATERKYRE